MNKLNLQPLKGFRDFLPPEALKRNWLKNKIIEVFELWGYEPLETPTLESLEIFKGQVGEDEKLFYKFKDSGGRDVALRYDQSVPTSRVVANNYQKLTMPFKRYQIQPVFRAEKPQKGRYRELTHCDADIFGIKSPYADAEVITLALDIYRRIGFKQARVLINDRTLLRSIPYKAIVAIDKIKKIGKEGVIKDMEKKGISNDKAKEYLDYVLNLKPNETISIILNYLKNAGFDESWYSFEPTIARSFSYSTGPIWEIEIPGFEVGSVLGGERFDGLIERLSGVPIPATGFGLGFDRTLEAAETLNIIPIIRSTTSVLITVFNEALFNHSLALSVYLRDNNIASELFPDSNTKLDKQLKYADKKNVPYVILLGPDEIKSDSVTIKNLITRKQTTVTKTDLLNNPAEYLA